jgi:hypothetical protein
VQSQRPHVVILGGGFAGLKTARVLPTFPAHLSEAVERSFLASPSGWAGHCPGPWASRTLPSWRPPSCSCGTRTRPPGAKSMGRLEKHHGKAKALSILAHKIGRAVFYMLARGTVFSAPKFLAA